MVAFLAGLACVRRYFASYNGFVATIRAAWVHPFKSGVHVMLKSVGIAVLASVVLVGCANQRFNVAGEVTAAPKMEDSQTFWLSGIGQNTTVDAAKVCGGAAQIGAVAVERAPLDVLLGMVTLGIYTPQTARVYCK